MANCSKIKKQAELACIERGTKSLALLLALDVEVALELLPRRDSLPVPGLGDVSDHLTRVVRPVLALRALLHLLLLSEYRSICACRRFAQIEYQNLQILSIMLDLGSNLRDYSGVV